MQRIKLNTVGVGGIIVINFLQYINAINWAQFVKFEMTRGVP